MLEFSPIGQPVPLVEELGRRAIAYGLAEESLTTNEIEALTRYHVAFATAIQSVPLDKVFDQEQTVQLTAASIEPEGWAAMRKLTSIAEQILRAGQG